MDARESPIRTRADISARGLNLRKLLPTSKLDAGCDRPHRRRRHDQPARAIRSRGCWAAADGDGALGMGQGQISNLLMELAGIDIAEALKFLVARRPQDSDPLRVRRLRGDDGVMTTRALAFDTTDTIIIGEGTISLRDETLRPATAAAAEGSQPVLVPRAAAGRTGRSRIRQFRPDYGARGPARRDRVGARQHRAACGVAGDAGTGPGRGCRSAAGATRSNACQLSWRCSAAAGRVSTCWSSITALTRSPIETTPSTASPSITGRWRMRCSVTICMQWSAVSVEADA